MKLLSFIAVIFVLFTPTIGIVASTPKNEARIEPSTLTSLPFDEVKEKVTTSIDNIVNNFKQIYYDLREYVLNLPEEVQQGLEEVFKQRSRI